MKSKIMMFCFDNMATLDNVLLHTLIQILSSINKYIMAYMAILHLWSGPEHGYFLYSWNLFFI